MILTDRSRHFRGLGGSDNCARKRYWGYEYMGTGIRLRSVSLPLATGTLVHSVLGDMIALSGDGMVPSREKVREIITQHTAAYKKQCSDKGFLGEDSEQVGYIIAEQSALIEGFTWGFYRTQFEWLLREFEVLRIEQEHEYPLGCGCGLADGLGSFDDHDSRECQGIGLMIRPDMELRHKASGRCQIWDWKTTGWDLDKNEYDQSPQMTLQCLGAEKDLGEAVDSYWVCGLLKGKRDFFSKAEKDSGGVKKQGSVFCYAWYKPGMGQIEREEWSFTSTKRSGFSRIPIWEAHLRGKAEGMSNLEHWVMEVLPEEIVREQFQILGPLQRPVHIEQELLNQVYGEALKWAEYKKLGQPGEMLDSYAPQAWGSCFNYRRPCEYLDLCRKTVFGEPLESGRFVRRMPHHEAELRELRLKGFAFEDAEAEGEDGN